MSIFNIKNKIKHPEMVNWFNLKTLYITAKQAIFSLLFGIYADRRIIQGIYDTIKNPGINFIDLSKSKTIHKKIYFDYVADLGDGFEPTYSIAYYLGKNSLEINGETLPRGEILIMGGDQVYPTPTKKAYKERLERPYEYALPRNNVNAVHPSLFILPGNHDWYDGLNLFLAKYCRGKGYLGKSAWKLSQTRSYFAIKLNADWWIWGIDIQLTDDIDQPQHDYFLKIATEEINDNTTNLILCAAVPAWTEQKAQESKLSKGLEHIANSVLNENCKNSKIYCLLAGDLHHYSRYTSDELKTAFITSGGGGAFLHPTHQLKRSIENVRWCGINQNLQLASHENTANGSQNNYSCFPSIQESKKMARGNIIFFFKNPLFCFLLGVIYLILSMINGEIYKYFLIFIILWFYSLNGETHWRDLKKLFLAFTHTTLHWLLLFFSHDVLLIFTESNLYSSLCMFFIGFLGGGFIFGLYLYFCSAVFSGHSNDAFSALRIKDYKNFIRFCISNNTLTIYPIGLKKVRRKDEWIEYIESTTHAKYEPKTQNKGFEPILIEPKIDINLRD